MPPSRSKQQQQQQQQQLESSSVDVTLLLDRLVSASTAPDVISSLESILDALQSRQISAHDIFLQDDNATAVAAAAAADENDTNAFLQALLQVLSQHYNGLPVGDEGANLAARIYKEFMKVGDKKSTITSAKTSTTRAIGEKLLLTPEPGRFLETLVDVAASDNDATAAAGENQEHDDDAAATTSLSSAYHNKPSSYTRVVCLQTLRLISQTHSKLTQQQLLAAPNGLHRLGGLLSPTANQDVAVRNEALQTAAVLAEWSAVAKVWVFADVPTTALQLALQEGGLTTGNVIVLDCLVLIQNLLKHDASLSNLWWDSQEDMIAPCLAQLLDLRLGTEFQNPSLSSKSKTRKPPLLQQQQKNKPTKKKQPAAVQDDLDDLMGSSGSGSKQHAAEAADDSKPESKQDEEQLPPAVVEVPHLTVAEEKIVAAVLDLMSLVLGNKSVQQLLWTKHKTGLVSLIWEMALIALPAPGRKPACAYPSVELQQRALIVTALYLNDSTFVQETRPDTLDRLLYLVCTGGQGESLDDKLALSQSALHVIRQVLSPEMTHDMLLRAMAPPMSSDGGGIDDGELQQPQQPPPPQVVDKLLNTISQNLLMSPDSTKESRDRQTILLAGSLGGLSLFLTDEPSRSMLLRLTSVGESSSALLEDILNVFSTDEHQKEQDSYNKLRKHRDESLIYLVLLRFLCIWISEAPIVVHAILSSPTSGSTLAGLLDTKHRDEHVVTMGCLLLGLIMQYMGGDSESKCGGWTRSGLLEMLSKRTGGVSRLTSRLERLKKLSSSESKTFPWSTCAHEWQVWSSWYEDRVLVVRKRLVQELTASTSDTNVESEDDEPISSSQTSKKALRKIISQQNTELEQLRESLSQAEKNVSRQGMYSTNYARACA